jgi:hypothetical protein
MRWMRWRVQHAIAHQGFAVQQVGCPAAQLVPQPAADRYAETLLGPIDKRTRDVAVQQFAQQPLAGAVASLQLNGQAPRELDNPVIEQRHASLQAHRHAGAIYLHQHVIRQVKCEVAGHHAFVGLRDAFSERCSWVFLRDRAMGVGSRHGLRSQHRHRPRASAWGYGRGLLAATTFVHPRRPSCGSARSIRSARSPPARTSGEPRSRPLRRPRPDWETAWSTRSPLPATSPG